MLTLTERAELIVSDAKSIGLWNEEEGKEFMRKVEENELTEDFIEIVEYEIGLLKSLFAEGDDKTLH